MKHPITIISTDWHLKQDNIKQLKFLITQKCELAQELGVKTVFCLGDIFESRTGQQQETLASLSEILEIFEEYQIQLIAIPGNHDKNFYTSAKSYLIPYKHHPYFHLVSESMDFAIEDVNFCLLPYFKENLWLEKYKKLTLPEVSLMRKGKKNIFLSHIAMNGSVNNDGSKVACNISVGDFREWDLVLLGHYHNAQQVGVNVFHIPSIQQNNFGENPEKGFTVVYDDCSTELVKSDFKEFEKITINLDTISKTDFNTLIKTHSNSDKNIRFELIGSTDKVKSINKEELGALGISVSIKVKEIEDTIEYAEQEIKEFNSTNIIDEFAEFCKEKEKDYDKGVIYLQKKLAV